MPVRKTKCVRMKLDFILEFDEEFDSIPIHLPNDGINRFISAGSLEIGIKGNPAIRGGARLSMDMHWPRDGVTVVTRNTPKPPLKKAKKRKS